VEERKASTTMGTEDPLPCCTASTADDSSDGTRKYSVCSGEKCRDASWPLGWDRMHSRRESEEDGGSHLM
jgi:hypothetical protein